MKTQVDLTVRTAGKTLSGQSELKRAAVTLAAKLLPEFSYINITITRDKEITELNSRYLNKKRPTDVIAFDLGPQPGKGKGSRVGEVVLSVDMADRQAKENDVTLRQELMRLMVHGRFIWPVMTISVGEEASRYEGDGAQGSSDAPMNRKCL
jgi:rRNA maturation RNase YbeY